MKYNITDVDVSLADNMNTEEGHKIIANLDQKITEQEIQLDLFEVSLTHCKEQIGKATSAIAECNQSIAPYNRNMNSDFLSPEITELIQSIKTEKEKFKFQKLVFEENMLVWRISGYITLISIDVKTMQKGLYSSQSEWDKRFYARQTYVLMYDAPKTKKLLEKDIITEVDKTYSLTDKLFAMWINKIYGNTDII